MRSRLFLPFLLLTKAVALGAFLLTTERVLAAAGFVAVDVVLALQVFLPRTQWLCPTIVRFETDRKEVWLTIDDGPDPEDTPQILDLLDRHHARVTFFQIGEKAEIHPELTKSIEERGHEIGCHTLTHPERSFWRAGPHRTRREVEGALSALQRAGVAPRWFRTPVGIKSIFLAPILRRHRLHAVSWTIRSGDVCAVGPAAIAARVRRELRPGAIILMHEGSVLHSRNRVAALAAVLEDLTAAGFRCVLPEPNVLRPRSSALPFPPSTPAKS